MRLIDADAIPYVSYLGDDELRVYKSKIDAMPTIDPVKHGRWIDGTSFGGVRCSECGYGAIIMLHYSSNYCPSCGARMDGTHDN